MWFFKKNKIKNEPDYAIGVVLEVGEKLRSLFNRLLFSGTVWSKLVAGQQNKQIAVQWCNCTSIRVFDFGVKCSFKGFAISCYSPWSLVGYSCFISRAALPVCCSCLLTFCSHMVSRWHNLLDFLPPKQLAGYEVLAALTIACWRRLGPRCSSKIKRGALRVCGRIFLKNSPWGQEVSFYIHSPCCGSG